MPATAATFTAGQTVTLTETRLGELVARPATITKVTARKITVECAGVERHFGHDGTALGSPELRAIAAPRIA